MKSGIHGLNHGSRNPLKFAAWQGNHKVSIYLSIYSETHTRTTSERVVCERGSIHGWQ